MAMSKINAIVLEVVDSDTIAINKGCDDGVAVGQRYLVYKLGKELFDPETKENLGQLEIVCGEAKVTHVQPRISTLKSDSFDSPPKKIVRKPSMGLNMMSLAALYGQGTGITEETVEMVRLPFNNVSEGCLAKQIK